MNWKRVGIAGGALATFVVGVSLVAYTTGKFTSEAAIFSPTSDLLGGGVIDESGATGGAVFSPTNDVISVSGSTNTPADTGTPAPSASPSAAGNGQLGAIKPADPIKITSQIGKSFSSLSDILKIGVPKLLISLAGLVMMVMFFINAIKLLFNAGNESGVADAKAGMLNAGVGFAIVLLAYAIVAFINGIFK